MFRDPELPRWRRACLRLLDVVYPPRCELCGTDTRDGRALCGACHGGLPRLTEPFCQCCGEAFPGVIDREFSCPNCHGMRFSFEFARPALVRDERLLELIRRLKYQRELHLAAELGRLAAGSFCDSRWADALAEGWPLVPVPLHPKRQRERHFNQAAEIACALSKLSGLRVLHALRRVRETGTQTLLSRRQRMENLRGAFEMTRLGLARAEGGAVLVDDVLTTGSTVHECAKVLRAAGFKRVGVITVMRG